MGELKHYAIVKTDKLTPELLRSSTSKSVAEIRFNADHSKAILAFDKHGHPAFLGYDWLDDETIKEVLASSEWAGGPGFWKSALNLIGLG